MDFAKERKIRNEQENQLYRSMMRKKVSEFLGNKPLSQFKIVKCPNDW